MGCLELGPWFLFRFPVIFSLRVFRAVFFCPLSYHIIFLTFFVAVQLRLCALLR